MKRSKFSLSYTKLLTMRMGQLIPAGCTEVLPGDSFRHGTAVLLRVSPLVAPLMHPVSVRVHHFFVPTRILSDGFADKFITGGSDGEGEDYGAVPTITAGAGGFAAKGLMDYFGVPPSVANLQVLALPVRAYNMIFNEYYRDQDLVTKLAVPTTSGNDTTSPVTIQTIAWEKDRFTSARPWPQKGPEVTLPLGDSAPIHAPGATGAAVSVHSDVDNANRYLYVDAAAPVNVKLRATGGAGADELYANLAEATGATVTQLREALAMQRFQEARAMFGSNYVDYLAFLGIRSSDARLQRPEYLGGGKATIAFTEVLQTSEDGTTPQGNMAGHGIAALQSRRYVRFFEEHGYVITMLSVRPRTMYMSGLDKMWNRRVREDWWQPEWEQVGQEEILNKEVRAAHAAPNGTFGWQERYSDYRHQQSLAVGEFRSTLNYWHLGRSFASDPALNAAFIGCVPRDDVYADTSSSTDKLWVMVRHSIQARRKLRKRATIGRTF